MQRSHLLEQSNGKKWNKNCKNKDPLEWSQTKNYALYHINGFKVHEHPQNKNKSKCDDKKESLQNPPHHFENLNKNIETEQAQDVRKKYMRDRMYYEQNLDGKNKKYQNMRYLIQKMDEVNKNYNQIHSRKPYKHSPILKIPKNNFQSLIANGLYFKDTEMQTDDCQNYVFNRIPYFQSPFVVNKYLLSKRLIVTSLAFSQHHKGKHEGSNEYKGRKYKKIRAGSKKKSKSDDQLEQIYEICRQKNKILEYFQKNLPIHYSTCHLTKQNIWDVKDRNTKISLLDSHNDLLSTSACRIQANARQNKINNMRKKNSKENSKA